MKYYKRNWEETRGDEFDNWGKSIWYFETENSGLPTKQMEVYENGKALKYDQKKLEDEYGGLGDQKLDLDEFSNFEITEQEFKKHWNEH
ncbi:hypothetical protein [Ulvibacter litoralis]|uniref:Uncharacterized protein n=1 Tax=Ulvibacter litoralis TaxID=227084 RepID=A0A1G7JIS7_9FLAO|nr:hypothetical protein [Ulvibacter litoralis]SDF24793.1 hypothetical protein SAMN05421855_1159 [Ulvibacter litoralis]